MPYWDDYYNCQTSESSDSDMYDLAAGLSDLSLASKQSVIDCGECFSCEHLDSCYDDPEDCDDCEKILTEVGCQNKWCAKHKCRENALKCSCTTERLLTKYKNGRKSVFGHFRCKRCKKKWNSAFAWVEDGELLTQDCKKCNISMKPFKAVSSTKIFIIATHNSEEKRVARFEP